MKNPIEVFHSDCLREIDAQGKDADFRKLTSTWFNAANKLKYSYHFSAFGRPIIQYPQDMAAVQELIWAVKPDLIIETGIAHGGSLIFSAAMLALIDYAEAALLWYIAQSACCGPQGNWHRHRYSRAQSRGN